jgi:hypothetical protein
MDLREVESQAHEESTNPNRPGITVQSWVAPLSVVPVELSAKAKSSTIQIHVKADERPRVWNLRERQEFEDLRLEVLETLSWEDFSASFDGHVWDSSGTPPQKGKTVTINEGVYGGAPPKPVVPINQILRPTFEWTTKAQLSPEQVAINERSLDSLERAARTDDAPLYCGHILRTVEDLSSKRYPRPNLQHVMLAAILTEGEERITVRGNHQQCYHRGCQEK